MTVKKRFFPSLPRKRWRPRSSFCRCCWNGALWQPQATISRDIKQLHLVKAPAGQGKYRYAVSDHGSKIHVADKLQTIFRESIVNVDYAQNLVVIHTMSGLANGAAAALDGMEIDQLIGTLAGDDTVLIIMRDNESAAELATSIRTMLH